MTKEELTVFTDERIKATSEALVATVVEKVVEKLKADKPAESQPASLGEVVKGITDLAGIVTELKSDFKALSDQVQKVETKTADVTTPEVPDHSEVIKGLQDELKAMTETVEKISHNVSATAPVGDPNVVANGKQKSTFDGVWSGLRKA